MTTGLCTSALGTTWSSEFICGSFPVSAGAQGGEGRRVHPRKDEERRGTHVSWEQAVWTSMLQVLTRLNGSRVQLELLMGVWGAPSADGQEWHSVWGCHGHTETSRAQTEGPHTPHEPEVLCTLGSSPCQPHASLCQLHARFMPAYTSPTTACANLYHWYHPIKSTHASATHTSLPKHAALCQPMLAYAQSY